jgi:hypothetical protein
MEYYETFNRDNVTLVNTKENQIIEITPEVFSPTTGSSTSSTC